MCFSPEASFGSGVFLSTVAVMTIRKALLNERSMLAFAILPAVFAAHQLIEGMVWITIDDDIKGWLWRYLYLSIAFLSWPVLVPYASWVAERVPARKTIFAAMLVMGICLTGYLGWKLGIEYTTIDVMREGRSLNYICQPLSAHPPIWVDYIYAIVTVGPLLLSSKSRIRLLGAAVGIAFGVTFTALHSVYFSTWCMASAVLSAMIYFAIGTANDFERVSAGEMLASDTAPPIEAANS
jgi:hypothetical protein